ncbi:MAG: VOC family protein [Candidatus Krumholzibacteriia bacterium]
MPESTEHPPGTFCWVELMTSDAEAAKRFYGELFGWDAQDDPVAEDTLYTMLLKDGRNVAALYQRTAQQAKMGIPSSWSSYVSVSSAGEVVDRARQHGGQVILEPMDVFDLGRMAVIQDPAGATVCAWEPLRTAGAHLKGEIATLCWNELMTPDPEAAGVFLSAVFGWQRHTAELGGMPYTTFEAAGQPAAGMVQIQKDWGRVPPHWLVYFAVADCDAAVERAENLGGELTAGPYDAPGVGRFAILRDPQGAAFAVIRLQGEARRRGGAGERAG